MLKVITDEAAIVRCQRRFAKSIRAAATDTLPVKLGHPGASEKARVAWSEGLGCWFFSRKIAGSRYWNAFGIGAPEKQGATAITCEINFPLGGVDRRTGGAFAQDRSGRIFVVHRGKLGGGRKGIGKSLFENHYRGVWEVMDDGDAERPVALIGVLHSPRFARQVAEFVWKIARIKEMAAVPSVQGELTFGELHFRPELVGVRCREVERETGADCDHGLILRDLSETLTQAGLWSGNDGNRDLMAINRAGRIGAVFQVRTEATLSDLHAGATQLLLNGLSLPNDPLLILLLPQPPESALQQKLKRLNINVLVYHWQEERASFPGLAPILAQLAS